MLPPLCRCSFPLHLVLPCLLRSGSLFGFPTTSLQPVTQLPSTSSSLHPSSLRLSSLSLSFSLSPFPAPPYFSSIPSALVSLRMKASVLLCRVVISSFSHLPASPALFTLEHCRRKSVSDLPSLNSELLDRSYPERETKKSTGRESIQTEISVCV